MNITTYTVTLTIDVPIYGTPGSDPEAYLKGILAQGAAEEITAYDDSFDMLSDHIDAGLIKVTYSEKL